LTFISVFSLVFGATPKTLVSV